MENIIGSIEKAKFIIYIFAFILTIIEVIQIIRRVIHKRPTRHLRKVWGIKDKEDVILVCSELEDPEEQQIVKDKLEDEQGEFIYNPKYGDLDAYFEVVYTLLKLYPNLKLRILSCGEAAKIKLEYDKTLILIGGPDYNTTTREFLQYAKIYYRSPDCEEQSTEYTNQTIHTPDVKEEMIFTETKKNWYSFITSKFTKKK